MTKIKFNDASKALFNALTEGGVSAEAMELYREEGWVSQKVFDTVVRLSQHSLREEVAIAKACNDTNYLRKLFEDVPDTRMIYELLTG